MSLYLNTLSTSPCVDTTRIAQSKRSIRLGALRPAIVLYEETHPLGEEIGDLSFGDLRRNPDMLLVLGTSLQVIGIQRLVRAFADVVRGEPSHVQTSKLPAGSPAHFRSAAAQHHRTVVFVNRTPPPSELSGLFDYWIEGDTDVWAAKCESYWTHAEQDIPANSTQNLASHLRDMNSSTRRTELRSKARAATMQGKGRRYNFVLALIVTLDGTK